MPSGDKLALLTAVVMVMEEKLGKYPRSILRSVGFSAEDIWLIEEATDKVLREEIFVKTNPEWVFYNEDGSRQNEGQTYMRKYEARYEAVPSLSETPRVLAVAKTKNDLYFEYKIEGQRDWSAGMSRLPLIEKALIGERYTFTIQ